MPHLILKSEEQTAKSIHIVLVDDHDIVRDGLEALLESEPHIQIVAKGSSGQDAVDLVKTYQPHILVLDINMPDMSGLEATEEIRKSNRLVKILILSMYSEIAYVKQAIHAGANGYLIKQSAAGVLLDAVEALWSGKEYFSAELIPELEHSDEAEEILTLREIEILKHIANGKTGRQIATELDLSYKTVDSHRQSIMRKLELHDIAGLTRYALQHNII